MTEPAKCCGNCKHFRDEPFLHTPTGKWKKDTCADCVFNPPMPTLPLAIIQGYGFHWPPRSRSAMRPTDGADCPCFEAKE